MSDSVSRSAPAPRTLAERVIAIVQGKPVELPNLHIANSHHIEHPPHHVLGFSCASDRREEIWTAMANVLVGEKIPINAMIEIPKWDARFHILGSNLIFGSFQLGPRVVSHRHFGRQGYSSSVLCKPIRRNTLEETMIAERQYQCHETESLTRFVAVMGKKLAENSWKGGWDRETVQELLVRLREESAELEAAVESGDPDLIASEAADVANFAMMVQDLYWR